MVLTKQTIQQLPNRVPSRKDILLNLTNLTVNKRQLPLRIVYGALLVVLAIILVAIDPVALIKSMFLDMNEGTFLFKMWQKAPFDVRNDVFIFNYTNLQAYIDGKDTKLRVEEVGPFVYNEIRTNEDMTIDKENGTLTFRPKNTLIYKPELSVDDQVKVIVPNYAILAISTYVRDIGGYFMNSGLYYLIKSLNAKLVRTMTAKELMWGFDDPIVHVANTIVPGWIDFDKIGIVDRIYVDRNYEVEVELKNDSRKYSINKWDHLEGFREQGFTTWNTSNLCNQLKYVYEGLQLPPNLPKQKVLKVFRSQVCRVLPFQFEDEVSLQGVNTYRYVLQDSAFNKTSEFACPCENNCMPDGFINISPCYYGFPISISKPHFEDVDPEQLNHMEGLKPDPELYKTTAQYEPSTGVPIRMIIHVQVNVAVRMSPGNTIIEPFDNKILPILRLNLHCDGPPTKIMNLLYLYLYVGPIGVIVTATILILTGLILGAQGIYTLVNPKYQVIPTKEVIKTPTAKVNDKFKSFRRKCSNVSIGLTNLGNINNDEDLAKEAVLLLGNTDNEFDLLDS